MIYSVSNGIIEIDKADMDLLDPYTWFITTRGVSATIRGKTVQLGRYLLELESPDFEVDHEDRNFLNFQRKNIRVVTKSINMHNKKGYGKSKFKGVVKASHSTKWQAQIRKNHQLYYLGLFKTEEEAARAVDKKAIELYGEYASLNFPQEMEKVM